MADHVWTIAEAKARMSEIMRRASAEGPQVIGTQKRYVLVPEAVWVELSARKQRLGTWLVENMPRGGGDLEQPDRRDPPRRAPFEDDAA
jgi:prevent-host-death family protein